MKKNLIKINEDKFGLQIAECNIKQKSLRKLMRVMLIDAEIK